jgi:hypothetical protein
MGSRSISSSRAVLRVASESGCSGSRSETAECSSGCGVPLGIGGASFGEGIVLEGEGEAPLSAGDCGDLEVSEPSSEILRDRVVVMTGDWAMYGQLAVAGIAGYQNVNIVVCDIVNAG